MQMHTYTKCKSKSTLTCSRKQAVQMNHQIQAIQDFEKFLTPLRVVFASASANFTLSTFVNRQRYFLHGYEARQLKYIPKVKTHCFVCKFCFVQLWEKFFSSKRYSVYAWIVWLNWPIMKPVGWPLMRITQVHQEQPKLFQQSSLVVVL